MMARLRMDENTSKCTIIWEIPDFSSLPETLDYYIDSPPFATADATWCLRMYPNRPKKKVSVVLSLVRFCSHYFQHLVNFEISIKEDTVVSCSYKGVVIDEDYKPVVLHPNFDLYVNHEEDNYYDDEDDDDDNLHNFHREELTLRSGVLTVRATLKILANLSETEITASSHRDHWAGYGKLSEDLKNLLLSQTDSDVTLRVKGMEFPAHRAIIGVRSPVFGAMLRTEMKEKVTGIIEIEDINPKVFVDFLLFLYTGSIDEPSTENLLLLYVAADKYDVEDLKFYCVRLLKRSFSVDTFGDIVSMGFLHKETDLIKEAVNYFSQHAMKILMTAQWQTFLHENPVEGNDLLTKAWQKKFSTYCE